MKSRGYAPTLSDSEVITMELVGEFLGIDADKKNWEYFSQHWHFLFPKLGLAQTFQNRQQTCGVLRSDSSFDDY